MFSKTLQSWKNWLPCQRGAEPPYDSADEYKMVICVRNDLKMRKGKIASQCCHAAVEAFRKQQNSAHIKRWLAQGQRKIVVKANSEAELLNLYETAHARRLPCALICDAGRTQIESGSHTACAVGPLPASALEPLTSRFKLL